VASELKLVWSHTRVYGLATALNRGAGLLLVPLYGHILSVDDFGLYALVTMVSDLAGVLLGMEIANSMVRVYFDHEEEQEQNRVVSTAVWASIGLIATIAALSSPLAWAACEALFHSQGHHALFRLALLGMIFHVLFSIDLNYLRIQKRPWAFLWVSLAKSLTLLSLNLFFVAGLHMGVWGIVWGTLLSIGLVSLVTTATIIRRVGRAFSGQALVSMFRFGLPLMPATLSDVVVNAADKYFLNRLIAIALVGEYALANRLASLLHMFVTGPFAQIWVVRRLETLGKSDTNEPFTGIFSTFIAVLTGAALALSLFAPELLRLLASAEYGAAVAVVPLLCLGYILLAINLHFQITLFHAKRTQLVLVVSFACMVANLPLNYLLIRSNGLVGAGTAMVLTNLLRALLTAWMGYLYCPRRVEFEWRRVAAIVVVAVAVYLPSRLWIGTEVSAGGLLAKGACLLLFAALVLLTPITRPDDRRQIGDLVRRLRRA